jgi:hypothetical protein
VVVRFEEGLLRRVQKALWNAAPLAIECIANTCILVRSPPRSTQASYQWLVRNQPLLLGG